MKKGVKKVVLDLIATYPGCTAQEYAKMVIDQGLCDSNSQKSLFSLQTTLIKEYREGRMPQIKVVKVDGKTRYFPADNLKSAMKAYFRLAARLEVTNTNKSASKYRPYNAYQPGAVQKDVLTYQVTP